MTEARTELQRIAVDARSRVEQAQFRREVDMQWLDSRMAGARMNRCLALIKRETQMEKDSQEKTDHAAIVNARAESEMALAREIELEKRRVAQVEMRRLVVRERDPELLELARKLRAGYVCRDLRRQIADNQYRRLQDKVEDQYSNCILQNSLGTDAEAEEKEMREQMDRKAAYKVELRQQMCVRQMNKHKQLQETLHEKTMMDETLKKFDEEDMCKLRAKKEKTQAMQCEMIKSLQTRAEWREERRRLAAQQEDRVRREAAEIESRQSNVEAEREKKFQMKEEINAKIAAKILAEEQERKERMDLISELQEQEYLERNVQLDAVERNNEESVKTSNQVELTRQMASKREQRLREKELDILYRNQMIERTAAEETKECEKRRRRHEAMLGYSAELLQQAAADRRRREADARDDDQRNNAVVAAHAQWREEVAAERRRLVSEHAPPVLGHLQSGVLQTGDLPALAKHAHLLAPAGPPVHRPRPKCNAQCRVIRDY